MSARYAVTALGLLAALLLAGSSATAGAEAAYAPRNLQIADTERSYLLRVPAAQLHTTPSPQRSGSPLVLMLHGHGSSADELVGQGRVRTAPYRAFVPIADREGLVLAAPQGLRGSDGERGWNDCRADAATNPRSDDVAFLLAVIDAIAGEVAIDRRRVYVVGTSNGGNMALRMAIDKPGKVAAAAAIVAAMPARSQCREPEKPVPVLFMNGTRDPLMPYKGGAVGGGSGDRGTVLSTDDSVEVWRRLADVPPPPEQTRYPDRNTHDDSRIERSRYLDAGGHPSVVLYRVEGGGHTEPSLGERYARFVTRLLGAQNGDAEMADEVWAFFKPHKNRH